MHTGGTTQVIKKAKATIEQCPDDSKNGEEASKASIKKDQVHFNQFIFPAVFLGGVLPVISEMIKLYPPGFYSKPFMPPR